VPFNYDPNASPPQAWLAFLDELWPAKDDQDGANIKALGEWFGYIVSGRTDLHKILMMVGDHGISVFPPEEQELSPPVDLAGTPIEIMVRNLAMKGYASQEAYWMITAWAYHAKHDLNQLPRGVRVFCEMCVRDCPFRGPPTEPVVWMIVVAAAVLAAVALGLYVWAVLDQELNVTFGSHEWAYAMTYQERLWQAEILNVGYKQEGYYEHGISLGYVISSINREYRGRTKTDWIGHKRGRETLEGRHPILYHVYRFTGWEVYFCGVMTRIGSRVCKLREGGDDPFKPRGPWSRPGGRRYTPTYRGCWQEFWWL